MSTQNEAKSVEALVHAYGEALNSGNGKAIGKFYTADGAVLPNGHKAIHKKQLDQITGQFLKKTSFKIDYLIENATVSGDYAIVESIATTSSNATTSSLENKTTRDLFVLRKDQGAWKIYRYIFNSVK